MFSKFTLERTACYGFCPEYKVEVHNNGTVVWEGIANVRNIGRRVYKLSSVKIAELNSLIENFGYYSYIYKPKGNYVTDYPSVNTSILYIDGRYKKIQHYLGDTLPTEGLTNFETEAEKIIGSNALI